MDVTEQVQSRRHVGDALAEVGATAATRHAHTDQVTEAFGWSMRDEHVDAGWNLLPLRGERLATRQVERPVVVLRLPRRAVEAHAFNRDLAVLEVHERGKHSAR